MPTNERISNFVFYLTEMKLTFQNSKRFVQSIILVTQFLQISPSRRGHSILTIFYQFY